jgi:hypothetical protein
MEKRYHPSGVGRKFRRRLRRSFVHFDVVRFGVYTEIFERRLQMLLASVLR